MTLLTKSNAKLEKSIDYGWRSFGLHLAPYKLSGKNLCSHASKGCIESCLNTSGHGNSHRVQVSRIQKTKFFLERRDEFLARLFREITAKINTAAKTKQKVSFRLNLTSDVSWESVKYLGKSFMEHFPDVQFMDYTKDDERMLRFIQGKLPKNYHLTFSRAEDNQTACKIISGCGGNLAVVFRGKLPKKYLGKQVINGDRHDLRFLDKKNVIVGLVAKGRGKKDETGFVLEP